MAVALKKVLNLKLAGYCPVDIIYKIKTNPDYRRLLENFASLSILQGLNYILPLITFPYLVRVLGVEKFGLLAFATATIGYFQIITDYGFNLSATREIAIHRENKEKVQEIFSAVMTIKFGLMLLSLILLSILVISFEKFRQDWEVYLLTFGMVVGNTLFPVWFFQGMERMKYITILNIIAKGLFTVAIFIFIREQSDYWKVPFINGIGFGVAGFMSLVIIFNSYNIKFKRIYLNEIKYQIKSGWPFFVSNILISLYTITIPFVLGIFSNNIVVGYYTAIDKIVVLLLSIFSPLYQSLYPFVIKLRTQSYKNANLFVLNCSKKIFPITIIVFICLCLFSKNIILFIYGLEFENLSLYLNILSLKFVFVVNAHIYANLFMLTFGYNKLWSNMILKSSIIGTSLIFFTVGLLKMDLLGATLSVVITEFVVLVFSIYNYLRLRWSDDSR